MSEIEIEAGKSAVRVEALRAAVALPAVEAAVAEARAFFARIVDFARVETLALRFVGQNVVGGADFFEFVFGVLVVRIQIGVQFARQFAIRLFDFVLRCVL